MTIENVVAGVQGIGNNPMGKFMIPEKEISTELVNQIKEKGYYPIGWNTSPDSCDLAVFPSEKHYDTRKKILHDKSAKRTLDKLNKGVCYIAEDGSIRTYCDKLEEYDRNNPE